MKISAFINAPIITVKSQVDSKDYLILDLGQITV